MSTRAYGWHAPDVGEAASPTDRSNRLVRVGFIGLGAMGTHTLRHVLGRPGVRVTALCDVDRTHLQNQAERVAERQPNVPCAQIGDFRDLDRSDDVDAVIISTPDHWHALQGIDAMRSGKDVYIEKPLTLTVAEGRRLCEVAAETGRICQTGTQQRSSREFRYACELVRNGYIGEVQSIQLTIPPNNKQCGPVDGEEPIPDTFDYDMWLGPAPRRPYYRARCHYSFRFISDYSGGQITNWGAHNLDIAQWALDADASGPVRVQGAGAFSTDGLFDTADDIDMTWTYASGVPVRCTTGGTQCRIVGSEATLHVGRGHFETTSEALRDVTFAPDDTRLYRSDDHMGNFLHCVRTRRPPACPPEIGHRSATVCHIGNIALRLGRALAWDPEAERFVDDDEANAMLSRPMRAPWAL